MELSVCCRSLRSVYTVLMLIRSQNNFLLFFFLSFFLVFVWAQSHSLRPVYTNITRKNICAEIPRHSAEMCEMTRIDVVCCCCFCVSFVVFAMSTLRYKNNINNNNNNDGCFRLYFVYLLSDNEFDMMTLDPHCNNIFTMSESISFTHSQTA